jgi:hypothetical protein
MGRRGGKKERREDMQIITLGRGNTMPVVKIY